MPSISRQVGTTGELLPVFIPNATVSTGAGLANVSSANVTVGWMRNNSTAVTSFTCTTGTLGTWATSSLVQVNSTFALGWYQLSVPDAVFASGSTAFLHMYGAASMAPVPVLLELTKTNNQQYTSSTIFSSTNTFLAVNSPVGVSTLTIPVGVSTGAIGVTSASIPFGVSSISTPVGVSSITTDVAVSSVGDKTGYALSQSFPANFASLVISAGGLVDSNIQTINDIIIVGDGSGTPFTV